MSGVILCLRPCSDLKTSLDFRGSSSFVFCRPCLRVCCWRLTCLFYRCGVHLHFCEQRVCAAKVTARGALNDTCLDCLASRLFYGPENGRAWLRKPTHYMQILCARKGDVRVEIAMRTPGNLHAHSLFRLQNVWMSKKVIISWYEDIENDPVWNPKRAIKWNGTRTEVSRKSRSKRETCICDTKGQEIPCPHAPLMRDDINHPFMIGCHSRLFPISFPPSLSHTHIILFYSFIYAIILSFRFVLRAGLWFSDLWRLQRQRRKQSHLLLVLI